MKLGPISVEVIVEFKPPKEALVCCAVLTVSYTTCAGTMLSHICRASWSVPAAGPYAADAACAACLQNTYLGEALWLFFVLLVLLMLGRAAFVFPISFMHNLWSREKLAFREMVVIWSALNTSFPWGFGCSLSPPPPPPPYTHAPPPFPPVQA